MNRHLTNQPYLDLVFRPTNNVLEALADRPIPPGVIEPAPTKHQLGIQARVIAHLKEHGGIDALTVQKLGTTDARKIFSRLRDKGYLYAADDAAGHEDRPNASGQGSYRWHRWTGKQ